MLDSRRIGCYFKGPIATQSGPGFPVIGQFAFSHIDHDGEISTVAHAFTQPVPIDEIVVHCTNESENCCPHFAIVGRPGS